MATINAAGTTSQKGITRQYQKSGTNGSGNIAPRDTGTILGTVPPGKPGIKLVDGTIQNSTDPLVSGQNPTPGVNQADNFVANTAAVGQGIPTVNAAFTAAAGKSLAPEHE